MATKYGVAISSQSRLTQKTPDAPPPPKRSSVETGDSISSIMENDHLNQQMPGKFSNTQNPGMKFKYSNRNQKSSDLSTDDDSSIDNQIADGQFAVVKRNPLLGTPAQNSLANRAVVKQEPKKHTYPKLKATGGVLAGGAAGAAAGAVAAGGVAGLTALGAAVTGGLIGAAAGSTVPVVGTIIGAVVGVAFGIAWGIRAKARQADMLDTKTKSWARTFQRHSAFAWARALDPVKLAKGIRRKIPFISGRRAALVRTGTQMTKCCRPIGATKPIKWEERGQDATVDEAKGALRYAAAAQMSYLSQNNLDRRDIGSSEKYETFATKKYMSWVDEQPGKAKDLFLPRYRSMKAPYADTGMTHGAGQGWDFQPISRQSSRLGRAIFSKLPESLQKSLDADGSFHDKDTGNRIMLHYDSVNNEVVMAFSGTGSDQKSTSLAQNLGNFANYLGGVPPSVEQAVLFGKAVRDAVAQYNDEHGGSPPINVVSTGHSRGGLQASVEAIKNGGKAVTFNPEPMGGGVRAYCNLLTSDRVPAGTSITNFGVKDDWLSGSGLASGAGNTWETVTGLPAPFIPGERKVLARAPGALGRHPDPIFHVAYRAGGGDPPKRWFPPKAPNVPNAPMGGQQLASSS